MKNLFTLKRLLLSVFVVCSLNALAYDFEVDGIYYNITDNINKTVEITHGDTKYCYINIPSNVIFNNTCYSVTGVGDKAFYECSITSIDIPNSVTRIGSKAFYMCDNLTDVRIGTGVTSVEQDAFCGCNKVQRIYITDLAAWCKIDFEDYRSHPAYFENYSTTLYLNNEVLYTVVVPEGITEIKDYTFYNCGIRGITFPSSVTSVGYHVLGFYPDYNNIRVVFSSNPSIAYNYFFSKANTTRKLVLNDSNAADFNTANANTYSDVSYTRTISEGKYGTIILPFAPDTASLENYAFYELVESGDNYMRFEEVATPVANTPYIYTLREGKENVAITGGKTTISLNIETPTVDGWETIGSFSNQSIDTSNGNYYALSATENEINRITKSLTVLPYRAYFKSTNASKSALKIYISGTTGIKEISSSEIDGFEDGAVFDLSGRKVSEPTKGNIYIKDGKKIMF